MTWVHFEGGRDKVYRLWHEGKHYEVRRDGTIYLLTNRKETRRFRPDGSGKVEHWTRRRMRGKAKDAVEAELKRQTSGFWLKRWYYRTKGRREAK